MACMVSVAPEIDECNESDLEVLILIDLSASMAKSDAIEDAKAAALASIDRLPRGAAFNIHGSADLFWSSLILIYFGHADGKRRRLDQIGGWHPKAIGATLQIAINIRRRYAPRYWKERRSVASVLFTRACSVGVVWLGAMPICEEHGVR